MKGIVSYVCKHGLPPGDSGVPLMGFKQGSGMARFMVYIFKQPSFPLPRSAGTKLRAFQFFIGGVS